MFKHWCMPRASLTDEQLEKRAGLFWRQTIRRVDVELIDAIQMACVTHDQVLTNLRCYGKTMHTSDSSVLSLCVAHQASLGASDAEFGSPHSAVATSCRQDKITTAVAPKPAHAFLQAPFYLQTPAPLAGLG
jgi:hypothetical protein